MKYAMRISMKPVVLVKKPDNSDCVLRNRPGTADSGSCRALK